MTAKQRLRTGRLLIGVLGWVAVGLVGAGVGAQEPAASALHTVGKGHFRYLFWSVYDAELSTRDGSFVDLQQSRPLALTLTYQRAITRDEFIQATLDQWRHLYGEVSPLQRQWAEQLTTIWRDVVPGDQLRCYVDTHAVAYFYLNGAAIGQMNQAQFAEQFFAIWLDARTSAPTLRRALLGQKK